MHRAKLSVSQTPLGSNLEPHISNTNWIDSYLSRNFADIKYSDWIANSRISDPRPSKGTFGKSPENSPEYQTPLTAAPQGFPDSSQKFLTGISMLYIKAGFLLQCSGESGIFSHPPALKIWLWAGILMQISIHQLTQKQPKSYQDMVN